MPETFEPCGPGCACNSLTLICWGPVDVEPRPLTPLCHDCGADLSHAEHRPAYAPKTDPLIKCLPCEAAAWARIDAAAATMPANPAYSNGWD